MFVKILSLLSGGLINRVMDTIDLKIKSETNREKIKGDLIKEYYRNRDDYMKSGGFVLMLLFAVPLALWFGAVLVYSIFWCAGCSYPQDWTIAALPSPLDDWAGLMIVSIFGVIGVSRFK